MRYAPATEVRKSYPDARCEEVWERGAPSSVWKVYGPRSVELGRGNTRAAAWRDAQCKLSNALK